MRGFEKYHLGKLEVYRYQDTATQSGFEVIPAYGGMLNRLWLNGRELVKSFDSEEELRADAWFTNWLLVPFPNRMYKGKYAWKGKVLKFPIHKHEEMHALHGFQERPCFEVVQKGDSGMIELVHQYDKEEDYYPFKFTFIVRYLLTEEEGFQVKVFFRNDGDQEMPVGLGWHPYFDLHSDLSDVSVQFSGPVQHVKVDSSQIPTGEMQLDERFSSDFALKDVALDHCFRLLSGHESRFEVKAYSKKSHMGIQVWQESGPKKFNHLQVFTHPTRKLLAIEPMTCNIDAFNNLDGLQILLPRTSMTGSFGVHLMDELALAEA